MSEVYTWKKPFLSNYSYIHLNNELIGQLKVLNITLTTQATIRGQNFLFESEGIFKSSSLIINSKIKKVIGEIRFNGFQKKATIQIGKNYYYWRKFSVFSRRWFILDADGVCLIENFKRKKLRVVEHADTDVLLLCGLKIYNNFNRLG